MSFRPRQLHFSPELNRIDPDFVNDRIEYFRQHFNKVEKIYKEEITDLKKNLEKQLSGISDDDQICDIETLYWGLISDIEVIHLRTHRYSTLLALYNYIELAMNQTCKKNQEEKKLPISLQEITGSGVERAKTYLDKMCSKSNSFSDHLWSHVKQINKLRNCIVHCNGILSEYTQETQIRKIINAENRLSIQESDFLSISPEYIELSFQRTRDFLVKLLTQ